ncbi:MAG: hypothetical protein LUQ21_01235 [Methanothrix sp.]|nr:hypothetical protein [Methanothrix sp.]
MGHIGVYPRQDQVDVLQAAGSSDDRRAHQQHSCQDHYPLDQRSHAYGVKAAQDGVGHDYDCPDDQSPLIGNVEEPG